MLYRDSIKLYQPKTSKYNQVPEADTATVQSLLAVIEENAGLTNSGYYDQLSGDAHLYLPGNNSYLVGIGYQIQGYFVEYSGRMYRIESVSIGKASLTTNQIEHIECSLTLVDKEAA